MPKVSQEYLDARRRGIVAAARKVFAEKGFVGASMASIIEASGLSTGSVYRYFPSKAALVAEIVGGRDGTEEGAFPAGESARDLLVRLMGYVTPPDAGAEHARLVVQIWAEASTSAVLRAVAVERHTSLRDHLAERYAAQGTGGPPTAADRARADAALAALIGYATLAAVAAPVDFAAVGRTIMTAFGDPTA